jgi:hypothetical protein
MKGAATDEGGYRAPLFIARGCMCFLHTHHVRHRCFGYTGSPPACGALLFESFLKLKTKIKTLIVPLRPINIL